MIELSNILKKAKIAAFKAVPFNLHKIKKSEVDQSTIDDMINDYFVDPGAPIVTTTDVKTYVNKPEVQQYIQSLLPGEQGEDFINKALGMQPAAIQQPVPTEEIVQRPLDVSTGFNLWESAMERINLSPGYAYARKSFGDVGDSIVSDTLEYYFAPTKPGQVNQKINYFLKKPKNFDKFPKLQAVKQPLFDFIQTNFPNQDKMGNSVPYKSFEEAVKVSRKKEGDMKQDAIADFLITNVGEDVFSQYLQSMITGEDEEGFEEISSFLNNAIFKKVQWLKFEQRRRGKSREISEHDSDFGGEGPGLYDQTPAPEEVPIETKEDMYLMANFVNPILKGYMFGTLDQALALNNRVLETAYSLDGDNSGYKADDIIKFKQSAENLDLFVTLLQKKIQEMGQKNTEGGSTKIDKWLNNLYKNNKQQIAGGFGEGTLDFIVSQAEKVGKTVQQLTDEDVQKLAAEYVKLQESFGQQLNWKPDWYSLVDYTDVGKQMNSLGKIKKLIYDHKENGEEAPEIQSKIGADLSKFIEDRQEQLNFINRTIDQENDNLAQFWMSAATDQISRFQNERQKKIEKVVDQMGWLDKDELNQDELDIVRKEIKPYTSTKTTKKEIGRKETTNPGGVYDPFIAGYEKGNSVALKIVRKLMNEDKSQGKINNIQIAQQMKALKLLNVEQFPEQYRDRVKEQLNNQILESKDIINKVISNVFINEKGKKEYKDKGMSKANRDMKKMMKGRITDLYPLMLNVRDKFQFGPNASGLLTSILPPQDDIVSGIGDPKEVKLYNKLKGPYSALPIEKEQVKHQTDKYKQRVNDLKQDRKQKESDKKEKVKQINKSDLPEKHKKIERQKVEDAFEKATELYTEIVKNEKNLKALYVMQDRLQNVEDEMKKYKKQKVDDAGEIINKVYRKAYYNREREKVNLEKSIKNLNNLIQEFKGRFNSKKEYVSYLNPEYKNVPFMSMIYAKLINAYKSIQKYGSWLNSPALYKYASQNTSYIEKCFDREVQKFHSLYKIFIN